MEELMDVMEGQYLAPLDGTVVERIMADPSAIGLIGALDWRTMDVGSLKGMIPGCGDALDILVNHGVVMRSGDHVRLSEPYQAFGSILYDAAGVYTALRSPKCGWYRDLGFLASYVACSLLSIMFDVEPTWEGESMMLAERSGLVDSDGVLTVHGKEVAFGLFSLVSEVFDTGNVDPGKLFQRWREVDIPKN